VLEAIDEIRSQALGFFNDYDAILCPVSFALARPHKASHDDSFDQWGYIQIFWPRPGAKTSRWRWRSRLKP
jgi:hypothetical protein